MKFELQAFLAWDLHIFETEGHLILDSPTRDVDDDIQLVRNAILKSCCKKWPVRDTLLEVQIGWNALRNG